MTGSPDDHQTLDLSATTDDELEQLLVHLEKVISRARVRQIEAVREVDRRDIARSDGARSLREWIAGRLDIHPGTASSLAMCADSAVVDSELASGEMSFDRAAGTARLAAYGANPIDLEHARGIAVQRLGQLAAMRRRMSSSDEADVYQSRHVALRPNLDATLHSGSIALSGTDADLLLAALDRRADQIAPHGRARPTLGQRRADALVAWAMDELDKQTRPTDAGTSIAKRHQSHRGRASVFVDARTAADSRGEAGGATTSGLKIGPNTLGEILCGGTIEVTRVDSGTVSAVGTSGSSIPPRIRRYVQHRDGQCTADGCTSRYRLEPHHIVERRAGGTNEADNLALLCWYHHHVMLHQRDYRIDPGSPPGRRRFLAPTTDSTD